MWKEYRRIKQRLILLILGWFPFGILVFGISSLSDWLCKFGLIKFGFVLGIFNLVLGISYMVFAMVTWLQYISYRCPSCDVSFRGRQLYRRTCPECGIPINKHCANYIIVAGKPRRDWLLEHWKLVLAIWFGASLSPILWVPIALKHSDAAKLSIAMAESNPSLTEKLGRPLKTGWFISGDLEVQLGTGSARLKIPVSGPSGSGSIYADVRRQAGIWHMRSLAFVKEGSADRLDLLANQGENPGAPSR
jgi:hypothetical protein